MDLESRERYEVYMKVETFSGLAALKGANFPGKTRPVFRGGTMALSGDFAHDLAPRIGYARGLV